MKYLVSAAAILVASTMFSGAAVAQDKPQLAFVVNIAATKAAFGESRPAR